jgi:alkylation response protein AidB-like acyl-CoA dehydrogenase
MLLSEPQSMIRDMARQFARREVLPHVRDWERTGVPREVMRKMGAAGLLGVCVSEDWGGAGADFVSYALAMEEIAAADGGLANLMSANNSPVCAALEKHGTPEQKQRFLRRLATGEMTGNIQLSEPQAGSDAANIQTTARRDGDRYILNGHKQFITAGSSADVAMIVVATDPAAGKRGISCFLTPTDNPGYKVLRKEHKLGHRSYDTCAIAFEDMSVPATDMLGEEGRGLAIALSGLSAGRIAVAAQSVGGARAAYEAALAYAQEREAFGKPIFEHQGVAFKLAEMATEIEVARNLYLHAAAVHDTGAPSLKQASMAKLHASEMAEKVASAAIQVFGGYGYLEDFPVEKIYRDVRVYQIYEGTSEVQKIVISRAIRDS